MSILNYKISYKLIKLLNSKTGVFIIGVGGHSKVIVEAAGLSGLSVIGLYDDNPITHCKVVYGLKVYGPIDSFESGSGIIAIGDNKVRKKITNRLSKVKWKNVVHPSAIVSKDVEIGEGTVIMAGAIIQPGTRIGKHCIINTGACVDHDCIIGDFVHIAPNCTLAGAVSVGEGSFIGIGSLVIPNKTIGSWTNVGAGSVIISDQPDNCTTLGVPAKPINFNNEQK